MKKIPLLMLSATFSLVLSPLSAMEKEATEIQKTFSVADVRKELNSTITRLILILNDLMSHQEISSSFSPFERLWAQKEALDKLLLSQTALDDAYKKAIEVQDIVKKSADQLGNSLDTATEKSMNDVASRLKNIGEILRLHQTSSLLENPSLNNDQL